MGIVSQVEIAKILSLNVSPDRIVYANTCKQRSHIRYAAKHNVSLITFDNEIELQKLHVEYPNARYVQATHAYVSELEMYGNTIVKYCVWKKRKKR